MLVEDSEEGEELGEMDAQITEYKEEKKVILAQIEGMLCGSITPLTR